MEVSRILAEIDAQISKLQQARELLSGTSAPVRGKRGRPKGSTKAAVQAAAKPVEAKKATARKTRKLTPEGRKRIADAMKRRWAEQKKVAAK